MTTMKLMRSLNDMLTELNYSSCRSNQASQLIILVMSFGMTIIKLILGLQSTYLNEIVRLIIIYYLGRIVNIALGALSFRSQAKWEIFT